METYTPTAPIADSDPLRKTPLRYRIHFNKDGKPLKTQLAQRFPQLSRRERRTILKQIRKATKKAQGDSHGR